MISADPMDNSMLPLIVDLDGTLIKTDLLFESANWFITRHPFQTYRLAGWLAAGKSSLKAHLAEDCDLDLAMLPYNESLVGWLSEQKSQGRRVVLATASHRQLAEAVARHLGLFDEILATEGDTNLKAQHKRDLLVNRYGKRGFDYVGNDAADLPVLQAANKGYVVSSSPTLIAKARGHGNIAEVFHNGQPPFCRSLLKAMRPHQWMKNLLIFVPLFAAHRYDEVASLWPALLAFLVFGLTASSVYLFNDLVDVAHDRNHHRKRHRPFAAGDLSLLQGWLIWPLLLTVAFITAGSILPPGFTATLAGYFALTIAYSLDLKQRPILDVLTLAALYTLRITAGAAVIGVPLSFWLLSLSMFIFLSLAFVKRYSELYEARGAKAEGQVSGRGYQRQDLEIVSSLGISAGYIAVLVLALYIQDSHTAELYRTPEFIWLACPILLYWVSRIWFIAHHGRMHGDPIVFALKDRVSWLVVASTIIIFGLARMMT